MSRNKKHSNHPFDPTISQGIIAILLVLLSIIIVLSFLGKAGAVGQILDEWILSFIFGKISSITPIIPLAFAWFLIRDKEQEYHIYQIIGIVLLFLSVTGLFHVNIPIDDMWRESLEGNGGGVLGMVAWPLKNYTSTLASYIILISLALISFLLLFNSLISPFIFFLRKFFSGFIHIFTSILDFKGEKEQKESFEESNEEEDEITDDTKNNEETSSEEEEEDDSDEEEGDEDDDELEENTRTTPKVHQIPKFVNPATEGPWSKPVIIKNVPPLNLLSDKRGKPTSGDIKRNTEIIRSTLAEFGIHVDMGEARVGPTVTQFTCKPAKGVKLSRITTLTNDLCLALAAHPIRIEAPIPGKALVGIEVPNTKAALVTLRELLESKTFKQREHNMMIGLGRDVSGHVWFADLPRMPHLLIAGATGSGKTVCMNTIILSLIYQNTAETVRLIMVDPKRVELTPYNGIPHLLTPVITNAQKTVNALKWTIGEMDRRFEMLSQSGNRNIESYNGTHPKSKLPHIVFIIDELADLMSLAANEVESGIIRLAQMARAVGIHLIVATQRPSVDVITGLMKANIPARIAFSVASLTDSRTILDASGAEKLLGRGDMLFQTAELSKPVRIQGSFISESEMKRVIDYLKGDETPEYDESIVGGNGSSSGTQSMFGGPTDERDPLFHEAKQSVVEAGKASASFLQRKFKVGYARAARMIDELEEAGVVGPADGAKPREIMIGIEDINPTMNAGGNVNVYKKQIPEIIDESEEIEEEEEEPIDDSSDEEYDESIEETENEEEIEEDIDDEEEEAYDYAEKEEEEEILEESSDEDSIEPFEENEKDANMRYN